MGGLHNMQLGTNIALFDQPPRDISPRTLIILEGYACDQITEKINRIEA